MACDPEQGIPAVHNNSDWALETPTHKHITANVNLHQLTTPNTSTTCCMETAKLTFQ